VVLGLLTFEVDRSVGFVDFVELGAQQTLADAAAPPVGMGADLDEIPARLVWALVMHQLETWHRELVAIRERLAVAALKRTLRMERWRLAIRRSPERDRYDVGGGVTDAARHETVGTQLATPELKRIGPSVLGDQPAEERVSRERARHGPGHLVEVGAADRRGGGRRPR
jgi:hypothetical protein